MNKAVQSALILIIGMIATGCEEAPAQADTKEEAPAAAPAAPEKAAADKAAEEKAAEEAKKRAEEEAKAQAALAENPITECCRALGKEGFTLRSVEYSTAARACGMAMEEKKDLAGALPMIEKELGGKPLPAECKPK
jgi:type IV secretory pathway VirB10-like protein